MVLVSSLSTAARASLPLLQGHATRETLLLLLGLRWRSLPSAVVRPLALTAVLFTGPIATEALNWWEGQPLPYRQPLLTRLGLRNLVVAPATEEFTFRACMAPLLLLHVSTVITRLSFGLLGAHDAPATAAACGLSSLLV